MPRVSPVPVSCRAHWRDESSPWPWGLRSPQLSQVRILWAPSLLWATIGWLSTEDRGTTRLPAGELEEASARVDEMNLGVMDGWLLLSFNTVPVLFLSPSPQSEDYNTDYICLSSSKLKQAPLQTLLLQWGAGTLRYFTPRSSFSSYENRCLR